jgi:hypothetical protein
MVREIDVGEAASKVVYGTWQLLLAPQAPQIITVITEENLYEVNRREKQALWISGVRALASTCLHAVTLFSTESLQENPELLRTLGFAILAYNIYALIDLAAARRNSSKLFESRIVSVRESIEDHKKSLQVDFK